MDPIRLSKSKVGLYNHCPLAWKFKYIDKIEEEYSIFLDIGKDVHDFIEHFFSITTPNESGELDNISKLKFTPNLQYKKNVSVFEIKRWREIKKRNLSVDYFYPVLNETSFLLEDCNIIGIVDRVHKCHKDDEFAPKVPSFVDGEYVLVENKTGKPTAKKCIDYELDLYWYKFIIERKHPEIKLKWGAIYFPFNNFIHHVQLFDEKVNLLIESINETKLKIEESIQSNTFKATPSKQKCAYCNYRSICMYKQ